jgi:hypothetical protein
VDDGDDTLTESCEGAVNFMVIEIRAGSLQKLPFGDVVEVGFGAARQAERFGFGITKSTVRGLRILFL